VMGYDLMENFKSPYFAKSISEFWRKWHISLSTWFRDYLYIPLGGNRNGLFRQYFNQFFVFLISGFWHGAKWTFVAWGAIHGIYLILALVRDKFLPDLSLPKNALGKTFNLIITFTLVMLAWVFFRANSLPDAFMIFGKIFTLNIHEVLLSSLNRVEMYFSLFLIILLMLKERYFFYISTTNDSHFYGIFLGIIILNYFLGVFNTNQFIYFQF
jgi:alginate O-acetyltransferase complex protein AlgI